ncbi:MAG: hypothetical protein M1834_005779 [Cirrosporium novae-zelandiae]|nr:MAG: hypothetical protein M1834_005779 [Cirrosporium novae-zelandiae]
MVVQLRSSTRPATTGSSSTSNPVYIDESSSEEGYDDDSDKGAPKRNPRRRTRTTTRRISYREVDSSDEEFQVSDEESINPRPKTKREPPRKHQQLRLNFRCKKPIEDVSGKKTYTIPRQEIQTTQKIPPWHTLPYEILVQIFNYASTPLYDHQTYLPTSSLSWLLDTSLVCKAFLEPALTALFYSPPLNPATRAQSLLELLGQSNPTFDYAVKIKRLDIEVRSTLAYSMGAGMGHFDLVNLVKRTPLLKHLHMQHMHDRPPYRDFGRPHTNKWLYPDDLFEALSSTGIRLQSFTWNARIMGTHHDMSFLKNVHTISAFSNLKVLKIINFNNNKPDDGVDELNQALAALKDLKSLTFESSPTVNSKLLPGLPNGLQYLALVNCTNLTSEMLQLFLSTHGTHLRELILDHNQSLSMSFLVNLAESCPKLEILKMDLQYYSSSANFDDSEPLYEDLLFPDEIPTWPSSLQVVEMVQLRNWDVSTAESFFTSLIDSSEELVKLRRLVLKAILKIGWRDRASFRERWIERLRKVYFRKSPPPNRDWDYSTDAKEISESSSKASQITEDESGDSRKRKYEHVGDSDMEPQRHLRKSIRLAKLAEVQRAAETKADHKGRAQAAGVTTRGIESSKSHESVDEEGNDYIQGLCEIVDIRIDNLRPAEEQFNEGDFLDEEASGDEEWDGTDPILIDDDPAW